MLNEFTLRGGRLQADLRAVTLGRTSGATDSKLGFDVGELIGIPNDAEA
jgi:hypothetical protein